MKNKDKKYIRKLFVHYKSEDACLHREGGEEWFEIINPYGKENIQVRWQENGLTFYFSYQHAHFNYDKKMKDNYLALTDYIDAFLSGEQAAVEFFKNGNNFFGGSWRMRGVDFSDAKRFMRVVFPEKESRRWLKKQIEEGGVSFKIRSFSGEQDLDADIVVKEGALLIEPGK